MVHLKVHESYKSNPIGRLFAAQIASVMIKHPEGSKLVSRKLNFDASRCFLFNRMLP